MITIKVYLLVESYLACRIQKMILSFLSFLTLSDLTKEQVGSLLSV